MIKIKKIKELGLAPSKCFVCIDETKVSYLERTPPISDNEAYFVIIVDGHRFDIICSEDDYNKLESAVFTKEKKSGHGTMVMPSCQNL